MILATEKGTVTKLDSTATYVKTTKTSACESCAAKDSCHTLGGGKEMEVEVINTIGAKEGDEVVMSLETSSLIKASFLIYVFPILCMIAGAVIGQEIVPNYNLSAAVWSLVLGFLFFFLAFLIVRLMGNKLSEKEKYRPKIIRIRKRK
ncbi:MAG: Fis family transcriptional regulator [Deltaproteobacteria bacterium]|nr:MAG: Fis family transcriptional regulator [Deltaproteobacteria bacterium]